MELRAGMATSIGPLAVRRSIEIAGAPERIWKEVESAERMKRWFHCDRLVLEPRVGGKFETEGNHGSVHYVFGGRVLVFEPNRELTVEWGWIPPRWSDTSLLTIRLEPLGVNRTRVDLIHHGFERLGDAGIEIQRSFDGGWDLSELEALRRVVEEA